MQGPPAGFNPNQSLLPDVTASITPAMGGGAMIGGGSSDFLTQLIPKLTKVYYKKENADVEYTIVKGILKTQKKAVTFNSTTTLSQ
jgi:hypothetical protein